MRILLVTVCGGLTREGGDVGKAFEGKDRRAGSIAAVQILGLPRSVPYRRAESLGDDCPNRAW